MFLLHFLGDARLEQMKIRRLKRNPPVITDYKKSLIGGDKFKVRGVDKYLTVYINDPFWGVLHTCDGSFSYDDVIEIMKSAIPKKITKIITTTPDAHNLVKRPTDTPGIDTVSIYMYVNMCITQMVIPRKFNHVATSTNNKLVVVEVFFF